MPDIYRSPIFVIKNMLKTGIIPYLIIDYTKNSLSVLQYRANNFILSDARFEDFNVPMILAVIKEKAVDELIVSATKVSVDFNVISIEKYNELLCIIADANDIVRSRMINVNSNKKGQIFCEDDYTTLIRMANKARQDEEFWEVD